ncbi:MULTISPECIES: M16 family metallopeptidase [Rodentibacter]|uniref:M16 family metallopeptidase n=1 Tax=Rodentibacter TaxID=1960084 RepID=UPI001CFC8FA8|nr:M16 family metallopeptidase [Rodentibacter sp. JRC1]GJI55173.1 putative zinc protease PqqL [Rodentibacter sp. JRC1]
MKKLTALLFLFMTLVSCTQTTSENQNTLPFHPDLLQGKLANGLRYYILENDDPKDRVYLRLVVNAGSMNEDEDQKGVAHIVEHMAFNGSQKYPGNQIINALEKLGMTFARDINAFTDFENTVYTLNLSNNDEQKLSLALEVIDEWMNHLTILPQDLDAERGVVLEEWRARLSPVLRLGDKKSAIEMANSRYIQRDPIGDVSIIKNVSPQRVKDFYRKWYRPDNMSLVIVGDIHKTKIQSLIKQKFAHAKTPATPLEKIDFHIPLINHLRFATVAEKETDYRSIEFSLFEPFQETNTEAGYKQDLIRAVMGGLLNTRLQEWEKRHPKLIDSAAFYDSLLGRETQQHLFSLQLNNTDYQQGVKLLFQFMAEIKQHGFSQTEFKQEIERLQALNQRRLDLKEGSLRIATQLLATSVMKNPVFLSKSQKYRLKSRLLKNITQQEVEQEFARIMALSSKLMLVTLPDPQHKLTLNQSEVENLWQISFNRSQPNWQNQQTKQTLPPLNLTEGDIVQEIRKDQGDIYEFQLGNGSKLIYLYSDKTPKQVYFKAMTAGGVRSVPEHDFHLLRSAAKVVDESGIGEISRQDFLHLFRKTPLGLSTVLDDYYQGFIGASKTDDFENVLKLFRLKLQSAPVDPDVLEKYKKDGLEYLHKKDKETEFARKVAKLRHPNVETVYSQTAQNLTALSASKLSRIYQHYLAEKTDFIYFIVGDIAVSEVRKLAKHYLANLEVKEQLRPSYAVKVAIPEKRLVVSGFSEPRAEVEIYFVANNPWQAENAYLFDVLADILQEKLRLLLREQESSIYSVNVSIFQEPQLPQAEGRITFSAAPHRVNHLLQLTRQVMDEIIQQGVEPELLAKKLVEKQIQIKQNFDSLVFVLNQVEQSYLLTQSPDLIYLYQQLERDITLEKVNAMAKKLLDRQTRFEAILTK